MNKFEKLTKDLTVGNRINFTEEVQSYKIVSRNERFLICIKPFNARKTYLYCIVDLVEGFRGPDNYHCRFDYDQVCEAEEALELLNSSAKQEPYNRDFWISSRSGIKLSIGKKVKNKDT